MPVRTRGALQHSPWAPDRHSLPALARGDARLGLALKLLAVVQLAAKAQSGLKGNIAGFSSTPVCDGVVLHNVCACVGLAAAAPAQKARERSKYTSAVFSTVHRLVMSATPPSGGPEVMLALVPRERERSSTLAALNALPGAPLRPSKPPPARPSARSLMASRHHAVAWRVRRKT